ncbi:response regulator [Halalkalicoccus jeotgali]|uniref:Multi-sensor signal transduction histidine kinase n=1 Tax=Halalkalicoccus jeotgali (strain DSM 18796 / CECT 7217 / JCM 14584 / KCTC 4019 / B3) TaxID=795797 RepID=D8J7X4_HALJB|nr:response regulator [Halalkalicoccus jeotgali]ADJ14087.1 multi-sensor signal transduction histidine kinase [Halalkalicoccus jeotgali B3]ELY33869.1 multi-sensor signal transduction histidine kinase [Halalkalicoccus jeotgali B3]
MNDELSAPVSVLCVDDELDSADLTAIRLEQLDERFSVETVADAEGGLEHVEDHSIDCVVSDYKMPEIDGLTFFEMVREQFPDLPFILFTGRGTPAVADDARSKGVTDYIEKDVPDRYETLADQIRTAVGKYRERRRLEDDLDFER